MDHKTPKNIRENKGEYKKHNKKTRTTISKERQEYVQTHHDQDSERYSSRNRTMVEKQ